MSLRYDIPRTGPRRMQLLAGCLAALSAGAVAQAQPCGVSTPAAIYNHAIPAQTGSFTVTMDATPLAVNGVLGDTGVGVNTNPPVGESQSFHTAATVRFNTVNARIEARNGSGYQAATAVPWTAGQTYRVRFVLDVPSHRYHAYVTPPGGSELLLGTALAFRSNYGSATRLDNVRGAVDAGSVRVCNVVVASACGLSTPAAIFNQPIPAQTGRFAVTLNATPLAVGGTLGDTGVGLNTNPPVGESQSFHTAATIRFNTANSRVEARNGSGYQAATAVAWAGGQSHRVRMLVDVPNHRYDAYVTPPGGSELLLGTALAFRSNYSSATRLDNVRGAVDAGSIRVCDIAVTPIASCTYAVSPLSASFPAAGGTGTVSVTAAAGCAWTATSQAAWITVTSGSTGSGNGTVSYSVAPNGSGSPTTGTLTIAGSTVSVSQAAGGGTTGTLQLKLTADGGAASNAIVSLGVPFAPGVLIDPALLVVRDAAGTEVPAYSASLATWPRDGSQRSVLVAFRASLAAAASANWTLSYGSPRGVSSGAMSPNPDGPIVALLAADWYAQSRAIGYQTTAARNTRYATWATEMEARLVGMSPLWESYGLGCSGTSNRRTYYDSPHALFQRAIHRGTPSAYRRARSEANWYRANALKWFNNDTVAVYGCFTPTSWNPATPMAQDILRTMGSQGMLDDYLLTGDPAAIKVVKAHGEAYRQNLDAQFGGSRPQIRRTERNMGWILMGLSSYYSVEPTPTVRAAMMRVVNDARAWQGASTSGGFEHDLFFHDSEECGVGTGGSPFMTSLLVDGLMDAYFLVNDSERAGIADVVVKTARWYRDLTLTADGTAFMYLWGCDDPNFDYYNSDSIFPDLNLLIVHTFGAAHFLTGDASWLGFADTMADHGVDNLFANRPKQWTQGNRSFMKYMGYRARALQP